MADRDRDLKHGHTAKPEAGPGAGKLAPPPPPPDVKVKIFVRGVVFEVTSEGEPTVSTGGSGRILGIDWKPKKPVKIGFMDWGAVDAIVWDAPPAPEPTDDPT
jgi:hypothetical protein